jgi:hypothetical protein
MGMLVMSASLLLIPIHVAARHSHFGLMHHTILLLCSSWSYHSLCHEYKHLPHSIFFYTDKVLCHTLTFHTLTLFCKKVFEKNKDALNAEYNFHNFHNLGFMTFSSSLLVGMICYYRGVLRNKNYHKRGLSNWKYHIPHMAMHTSASICLTLVCLL